MNNIVLKAKDFESISRIALKEASQALSRMLNQEIKVVSSSVLMLSPLDLIDVLGRELPTEVVASYSEFKGMIEGIILMVIPLEHAANTAKSLIESLLGTTMLDEEMAIDLLKEIANIIFGSIASSMYNKYGLVIKYSVPKVVIDNFIAILDNIALMYVTKLEKVIVMNAEIIGGKGIHVKILIIPKERWLHQ